MATLRDIRRRIVGVKSTQKITKAMKMVAAAKLRRAQENIIQARPYARKMAEMLAHLSSKADISRFPQLAERPVQSAAVVIVTSDRGLCGAFNANIIRAATAHISKNYAKEQAGLKLSLFCIGKKGAEFFSKRGYPVVSKHLGIFNSFDFSTARAIAGELIAGYDSGKFDKVEIIYNEFKNAVQQKIVIEQYLPLRRESPPEESQFGHSLIDYIYEPSSDEIIPILVPKHLNFQLWRILLESNASEQGARMAAMENASTNAKDLIRSLELTYNKARQASITKELLEIVSGAEALKAAG